MQASLTLLKAGPLVTITDQGRFGQAKLGLTQGGPADAHAFKLANMILSNCENSSCLEVMLGDVKLQASSDCVICVTGTDAVVTLDGCPAQLWRSYQLKKGQCLEIQRPNIGLYNYLAVAGGFQLAPQFGSTTTVLREQIGGFNGCALQVKAQLPFDPSQQQRTLRRLDQQYIPPQTTSQTLKIIPGFQYRQFCKSSLSVFTSSQYQISSAANKMGYRLNGPAIQHSISQMLSEGIPYGAVQVPADGQPIVLLNDRQTIGGYPKIGSLLSLDCYKLNQKRPGERVDLEFITPEQAHNALLLYQHSLEQIKLIGIKSYR